MSDSKEEEVIKDYKLKLDKLKTAILEERKKNQTYLQKIKECEKIYSEKDADVNIALREKQKLEEQHNFEQSVKAKETIINAFDVIFHKEKFSQDKLDKLIQENKDLRNTNKDLNIKLLEEKEFYEESKVTFQSKLSMKSLKLKELVNQKNDAYKEISLINNNMEKLTKQNTQYFKERDQYEQKYILHKRKIIESQNHLEQNMEMLKETQKKSKELDNVIKGLNDTLSTLAIKLDDIKKKSFNQGLKYQEFKILKKGDLLKKFNAIGFGKNEETNKIEMIIFKKDEERHVPFSNISKFEIDDKDHNAINLEYYFGYNRELKKLTFIVHKRLQPILLETYRKFDSEFVKAEAMM